MQKTEIFPRIFSWFVSAGLPLRKPEAHIVLHQSQSYCSLTGETQGKKITKQRLLLMILAAVKAAT